ncbi:MAG: hypothetical protein JJE49_08610 [Peptostreptococcaceae bacterium]|nr:hypothetical protein [Peptostreptococcaceae bacterium]
MKENKKRLLPKKNKKSLSNDEISELTIAFEKMLENMREKLLENMLTTFENDVDKVLFK